jgi:hypothetical protein
VLQVPDFRFGVSWYQAPTPHDKFNGDHTAGFQAPSTRNFAPSDSPVGDIR